MIKKAYFSGGCFWGMEELFRQQKGVTDTEVGYTGGSNSNPDYNNHLGHAEALEIAYDDSKTSYEKLLDYFFQVHDPTTLDRQGNDIGASYRSAVFYQNESELNDAKEMIQLVNDSKNWKGPVVTSLEPFERFWPAENYHQDYLQKNKGGYTCHFVRPHGSYLS